MLAEAGMIAIALGVGVGLLVMGASLGIGRLAASAVESIARQPEAFGNIFTVAIVTAALIEGLAFAALFIALTSLNDHITTVLSVAH